MAASLKPEEFEQLATLGDVARHHGRTRGSHVAMSFEGRATTYAELDRHSNQVADALMAAGVGRNKCVAYLGKNSDRYFEILLGAAKAGPIIAPIGWRLSPQEVAYILEDAQAPIVFAGPECVECLVAARAQVEKPPTRWSRWRRVGARFHSTRNGATRGRCATRCLTSIPRTTPFCSTPPAQQGGRRG